ncbi:hypothetical protein SAMN04487981_103267 [Streptomyces sp. cf386]|uniref:hypothetical protein n=1 Tax=Streptomyces sp. cf386 TaxID=1761904 RepID=UPI000888C138|nr:hypothetical protein [Streptomyces sp. cf386]SDN01682.1 hypothetical protein SAMN04487981_103267 [Streptomyces sp. cf386]
MALTRRAVLLSAGALGVGATLSDVLTRPSAAADGWWNSRRSANGWPIDTAAIESFRVEGSPATVRLHREAAPVLLHLARRWHYEVMPLRGSQDVLGHRTEGAVRLAYESNYLSGSAIALLGAGDGLWPLQEAVVRDILADYGGVVRWGADLSPAATCHFQIDVGPNAKPLTHLTKTFRDRAVHHNGPRPGAVEDPATPERRTRARRLAKDQSKN